MQGEVRINGEVGSLTEARFKHLVAFVPQEDIMPRDLTVAEVRACMTASVHL